MLSNNLHIFNCSDPRTIKNKYTGKYIQVPCGKCDSCKVQRITKYVPSLIREAQKANHVYFVTLTYQDKYLPILDLSHYVPKENQKQTYEELYHRSIDFIDFKMGLLPVLQTSDVQKFLKRLRKNIFQSYGRYSQFRYFISGDYGSTLFRPHWHCLFFTENSVGRDSFRSLLLDAWSVQGSHGVSEQIGVVDFQDAFGAAQYVSTYVNLSDHRPAIYEFQAFRPHPLHSNYPSLGSQVSMLENVQSIVERGLTEVTIYSPKLCNWQQTALLPNFIYKYFPRIPSYLQLSRVERREIYGIFIRTLSLGRKDRLAYISKLLSINTFLNDYLTLGFVNLTTEQIEQKIDRVYYAVKRLYNQSLTLGYSLMEYDAFIERFFIKRSYLGLYKQLYYEQEISKSYGLSDELLQSVINGKVSPAVVDAEWFRQRSEKLKKLIKRKCDNAYLERHPEFKQFHN